MVRLVLCTRNAAAEWGADLEVRVSVARARITLVPVPGTLAVLVVLPVLPVLAVPLLFVLLELVLCLLGPLRVALRGGNQLGQHPGEGVDLVAA